MSKNKNAKLNKFKIFVILIFMVTSIVFVTSSTKILNTPSDIVIVEKGQISFEESTYGYIIRNEKVLQGENIKNGIVQIVSEGERASKDESVFRYYSEKEDDLVKQISELDTQINEAIEESGIKILSSEIVSLESQIEASVNNMYGLNDLQKIQEYKTKIEGYMSKKAKISGDASPSESKVKSLINKRSNLESELEASSEIVKTPISGLVSYRVDGLEDFFKTEDFSYLSKEVLDNLNLKVGTVIPQSSEKGKIIDNYSCYIAVNMNTEKALNAKIGDNVTLRLSNSNEVPAQIVYLSNVNEDGRILIFQIKKSVQDLIEYRKISCEVEWWNFQGLKVNNSALITDGDKTYVEKSRTGYTEKILVKIERQNDTYSIVSNYTDEELFEMGYTEEEISDMSDLKLYDQVLVQNK